MGAVKKTNTSTRAQTLAPHASCAHNSNLSHSQTGSGQQHTRRDDVLEWLSKAVWPHCLHCTGCRCSTGRTASLVSSADQAGAAITPIVSRGATLSAHLYLLASARVFASWMRSQTAANMMNSRQMEAIGAASHTPTQHRMAQAAAAATNESVCKPISKLSAGNNMLA